MRLRFEGCVWVACLVVMYSVEERSAGECVRVEDSIAMPRYFQCISM